MDVVEEEPVIFTTSAEAPSVGDGATGITCYHQSEFRDEQYITAHKTDLKSDNRGEGVDIFIQPEHTDNNFITYELSENSQFESSAFNNPLYASLDNCAMNYENEKL